MPREARKKSSSGIYHVMLRGINRQTIFEDDEDKERFLETLKKYKDISKYQLYSYCLMDNHVHLLLREAEETISEAIKRISSSYVYWYNMKYERCGHLFQERFKSENVDSTTYFLTVLRYIHQNPLKAGLEKNVFESKWTSLNEYINEVEIVDIDKGLNLFSSDRKIAIKLFTKYMCETNDDQCLDYKVKVKMPDSEVREFLYTLGITNISTLQQMPKENRDTILVRLKELTGVTVRQISRVTGISKSVIQRASAGGVSLSYIQKSSSTNDLFLKETIDRKFRRS
jgi:putative transposase